MAKPNQPLFVSIYTLVVATHYYKRFSNGITNWEPIVVHKRRSDVVSSELGLEESGSW